MGQQAGDFVPVKFPAALFRRGPCRKALPDYAHAMRVVPTSTYRVGHGASMRPLRTLATTPPTDAAGSAHIAKFV